MASKARAFGEAGFAVRHSYSTTNKHGSTFRFQNIPPPPFLVLVGTFSEQIQTPELVNPMSKGFVIGGGLQATFHFLRLQPELRYTRWSNATFAGTLPVGVNFGTSSLQSNRNTFDFLIGVYLLDHVYRFQLGANYARTLSIPAAQTCLGGVPCTFSAAPGGVVYATPFNAYRQDNPSVLDLRIEKTVRLNETNRLRLFTDIFNLTNQYAAESINVATGPAFQNPTAILGPRTARIGFRYLW